MYILLDYHLSSQFFVNIVSTTDGFMMIMSNYMNVIYLNPRVKK